MSKGLLMRALPGILLVIMLVMMPGAAVMAQSVPELPAGDGSGDTPDMFIRVVAPTAAPLAKGAESIRLSSLRGKVVLLDMFSSQCPHCIDHAPHVAEMYNQYRQRGFTVLGLATDEQGRANDVRAFMTTAKIGYTVGFLTSEVIAYFMDNRNHGVPQMVLFGRDGKMVKRLIGWNEKTGQELRAAVEAQLAQAPASRAARTR